MDDTEFLTTEQLAERWHMTPAAVAKARHRGVGPVATKIGKRLLYRMSDVVAFEQKRREGATHAA